MYTTYYDRWVTGEFEPSLQGGDRHENERRDLADLQEQRAELERELEDYPTAEDATEDEAIAVVRIMSEIRTLDEQIRDLKLEIGE